MPKIVSGIDSARMPAKFPPVTVGWATVGCQRFPGSGSQAIMYPS